MSSKETRRRKSSGKIKKPNLPNEMIEHIFTFTDIDTCLKNNNIHSAKKIFKKNPKQYPLQKYAKSGNYKMVNFLINDVKVKSDLNSLNYAISNDRDNVDVVKCIHKNLNSPLSPNTINNAVLYGNNKVIKYLHKEAEQPINGRAFIAATLSGKLNTLKYLYTISDFPVSEQMVTTSILNGNLDVLKFFHEEKKFPLNEDYLDIATHGIKDNVDYIVKKNIIRYIKECLKR